MQVSPHNNSIRNLQRSANTALQSSESLSQTAGAGSRLEQLVSADTSQKSNKFSDNQTKQNPQALSNVSVNTLSEVAITLASLASRAKNAHASTLESTSNESALSPGEHEALDEITESFQQSFADKAGDKDQFHELMRQTFGDSYNYENAEAIRNQTLVGDFSWMPDVQLVDGATLTDVSGQQAPGQGLGAYAQDTNTVYLSRELLLNDPTKAKAILTEEVGHALDVQLNTNDAAGDEGEIFAILLSGGELSDTELQALQAENDSGTIIVNGQKVEVEFGWFKKLTRGISRAFRSVGRAFKKAFDAIITSKIFSAILFICQFIPIPIVQIAVRVINIVKAAYSVYQGVKHGSISAILSGVASVAGGISSVGNMMGATGSWVGTAAKVASYAKSASVAYNVIAKGDFAAAASLASNYFGSDSTVATALDYVGKADQIHNAVKQGNYLGAITGGTSVLQDFTGPEGDVILEIIGKHAGTLKKIDQARSSGEYLQALSLVDATYGDLIGLPEESTQIISNIKTGLSYAQAVDRMIDNNDYAAAATMLADGSLLLIKNPETLDKINNAAATIGTISQAVDAFESGNYDQSIVLSADALGSPLNDHTRAFVENLQVKSNAVQAFVTNVKKGDIDASTSNLNVLFQGNNTNVVNIFHNAATAALNLKELNSALKTDNFDQAAKSAFRLADQATQGQLSQSLRAYADELEGRVKVALSGVIPALKVDVA